MYARDDALKVRQPLCHIGELALEGRMVEDVLNGVQSVVDTRDLAKRHAEPDAEEALAYQVLSK